MGLREANQNFSKAIKAVRAGNVVVLTERGTPIATIQPIAGVKTDEEAMEQLIAEGIIIPAETPGSIWDDDWKPLRIPGASLSKSLRKIRDEE